MTNENIAIYNAKTDELIVRAMTDEEADTRGNEIAVNAKIKAEQESATTAAKASLLARLGITADEAKLLIG